MSHLPDYLQPQSAAVREAASRLRASRRVLVIPHRKPDGDCLGAATALLGVCDEWGVAADGFCLDPVPAYLQFLPLTHRLTADRAALAERYDTIIVLDADVRIAGVADLLPAVPHTHLINIDHHVTNAGTDGLAIVSPEASSTCEMLHYAFGFWGAPRTPDIATSILCGIFTDTGSLGNPAATASAFAAAGALLLQGARWHQISTATRRTRPLGVWQVWGAGLQRLRYSPTHQMAVTFIRADEVARAGVEGVEGAANFLGAFCKVPTILVLREERDGTIKGSARTIREDVDVAALAGRLGGGGHRKASGFIISGRIAEADGQWHVSGPASEQLAALNEILATCDHQA